MSLGLPVLCLDLGGPGVSVNSSCGKAIQAEGRSEEELVAEMSSYLTELLGDPSVLESLAAGAQRRVASLSWQAAINGVYGSFIATARASETLAAQREVNP
jgi:hypothetical protein